MQIETEQLRNSLLSAVSHDLRTPLASIVGAASTLAEEEKLPDDVRLDLLHSISDEANRLHRLVSNLLEMTRLQSGAVRVRKEWQPLEEVVGAVLSRYEKEFGARKVTTNVPPDLPSVPIDATLMEQVFINLIENALKYSPPTGSLHIAALEGENAVLVEVSDRGAGVPEGESGDIFDPFFAPRRPAASTPITAKARVGDWRFAEPSSKRAAEKSGTKTVRAAAPCFASRFR